MTDGRRDPRRLPQLRERLGDPPWIRLGIDLEAPAGRQRWWCWSRIASERDAEAKREAAWRRLEERWGCAPRALVAAGAPALAESLAGCGLRKADGVAGSLVRAAASLVTHCDGDLERLASEAGDLEELGAGLVRLAPGFGPATVLRFLRPLRRVWPAAAETPLSPAAHAAAAHLGWVPDGSDPSDGPESFLRACEDRADWHFASAEYWLETLGARACARGRSDRCWLGDDCPVAATSSTSTGLEDEDFAG